MGRPAPDESTVAGQSRVPFSYECDYDAEMQFTFEDAEVKNCLDELGKEYLRVGAEKCQNLKDGSHLSAFLLLGVRSISLCYGLPLLWNGFCLDSYDVARRGFLEACYLMYEFRLKDSFGKTQRWLKGKGGTWKANIKRWEKLVLTDGPSVLGPEYGGFSELTHPTAQAAQNSGGVLTYHLKVHGAEDEFKERAKVLRADIANTFFRLAWITFVQRQEFLEVPFDLNRLKLTAVFYVRFNQYLTERNKP